MSATLCCNTFEDLAIREIYHLSNLSDLTDLSDLSGLTDVSVPSDLSGLTNVSALTDLSVLADDNYATMPLESVAPKQRPVDEEVLHTSFEQALSDRLIALNDHWHTHNHSDCELTSVQQQVPSYATDLLLASPTRIDIDTEPLNFPAETTERHWAHRIMLACFMLMLLMIGFDLMGLLVLHIR